MDQSIKKQAGLIMSIFFGIILIFGYCSRHEKIVEIDRLEKNIEAYKDTVKYKNNAIGTLTASKKAFETTVKELKNEVWIKDEKINKLTKDFNELKSVSKIQTQVNVPEIKIPYIDTIPFFFERKTEVRDKYFSFDLKSNQLGNTIYNLNLENTSYIILGQKRDGLFKPLYWTTDVTNTNPYFKTVDIQVQIIQEKPPFYNKFWFRAAEIALSFGAGRATKK